MSIVREGEFLTVFNICTTVFNDISTDIFKKQKKYPVLVLLTGNQHYFNIAFISFIL